MFDINTLEGKRIPLKRTHIEGIGSDPVTLAVNEYLSTKAEGVELALYPAFEIADILENNGVVGTLMTAGTLDCWFQRYVWGHEMQPGTIVIYLQDTEDGEAPDERLWIGIQETTQ